eukprot:1717761-Pleurochrysis_carterae.AAC.1
MSFGPGRAAVDRRARMSWWKGSTRTGQSALNRTSGRQQCAGATLWAYSHRRSPAPVAEVVWLNADLAAISGPRRTRDTDDGIKRKSPKAADGLVLATRETCSLLVRQRLAL